MGGGEFEGHFGTDMQPDISKPIQFINLCSENRDSLIYLTFKITTNTTNCNKVQRNTVKLLNIRTPKKLL